jgi:lysophospholipase L1-like esterase
MMNRWLRPVLCFLLSLAVPGFLSAQDYKAGVAAVVITPQEPTWLSGYGGRTKPAEGKIHDLYAKALAVQDQNAERFVLVTLDLGSVSDQITTHVHTKLAKKHKLPRAALMLNVSHTHCAPEVAAERRIFHELTDAEEAKLVKYIAWLEDRIVEAADQALTSLQPAWLSVSRSSADFASNRRLPTEKGYINSQNKNGVSDPEVPVLRVADRDNKLLAVVFGYACHNTTLNFQQYCGDYAGFAQYDLEERYPGAKALFFMGCGGDQNPYPRHGPRGLEHARSHGKTLADAVVKGLESKQDFFKGPLKVAYDVVSLPLEPLPPRERLEADARQAKGLAARKARYLLDKLKTDGQVDLMQTCPLHAVSFGNNLLLIGIGGETVIDYALQCKKEFRGPFIWASGYNDDVFAYLPSARVLRQGGYEGRDGILHQLTPTPFAVNVEKRVMGGVRKLVEQVAPAALEGPTVRIVTLGDSITKGVRPGVTKEETFAWLLQQGLQQEGIKAEVINVGIGGEDSQQALARLDRAILALKPDLVTVMYGTNDSWVYKGKSDSKLTKEEYRTNLTQLVRSLREADVISVLMTEPCLGNKHEPNGAGEHPNKRLTEYVKICREVAREQQTPLVDHFEHWTKANSGGTDIGTWTTDQCHPNRKGNEEMTRTMLPVVLKALRDRQ